MNLKDILFMTRAHTIKPDADLFDLLLAKKLDKGIIRTIKGNPLRFSARKAQKAQNPSLSLLPIQDLHGYDHAWIGGMGKNKLPNTTITSGTNNQVTYTVNDDGTIALSGTASDVAQRTGSFSLKAGSYIFTSGITESFSTYDTYLYANGSTIARGNNASAPGNAFTLAEDSTVTLVIRVRSGVNANGVVVYPMVRLSTETDATFAPYENICPISGRESADVDGCGKNLAKPTRTIGETWSSRGIDYMCNADYSISMSGTYSGTQFGQQLVASVTLPAGTYVFNGQNNADVNKKATLQLYNPVTQTQLINKDTNTDFEFTLTETTYLYINIGMRVSFSSTEPITMKPMIRRVEDDYVYEPYVNQTDITFAFGQTVYGGKIDFDTGVMSIDTLGVDLGSLSWSASSEPIVFYADPRTLGEFIGVGKTFIACDSYQCQDNASGVGTVRNYPDGSICGFTNPDANYHRIYVRDDRFTTKEAFSEAVNGVYACYKLATPQTIQLTPQEINLLKGVNNIWTDGDSIELTYKA